MTHYLLSLKQVSLCRGEVISDNDGRLMLISPFRIGPER